MKFLRTNHDSCRKRHGNVNTLLLTFVSKKKQKNILLDPSIVVEVENEVIEQALIKW